jgi:hypothetical protein
VVARGAVAFSTWRAPVREELLSVGRLAAVQWLGVIVGPMRADRAGPSPPPRLVCRSLGFPLVGSIGRRTSGSHIAQLACVRRFVGSQQLWPARWMAESPVTSTEDWRSTYERGKKVVGQDGSKTRRSTGWMIVALHFWWCKVEAEIRASYGNEYRAR